MNYQRLGWYLKHGKHLITIYRMNEFLKLRQGKFQRGPDSDRERRQKTKQSRDHEMAIQNSKQVNTKEHVESMP